MSRTRFYDLYKIRDHIITPHWSKMGVPRVPDCDKDRHGFWVKPVPDFRVKAESVFQACCFAHKSILSVEHTQRLGIWHFPKHEGWDADDFND